MEAAHAPVTLGSSQSQGVDVDGFRVTRVRFPPLLRLPLHTHERATVAVILSGSFDGLMRSASRPCPAATIITEPPGEPHGNIFERGGARVLTVQPDPARQVLLEPFSGVLGEVNHLRDAAIATIARRAAIELARPDDIAPFAIEGLVLELLALAARQRNRAAEAVAGRAPRWLAEARSLLHDRFAERLGVAEVAEAVGVHPVHLARVFRLHYGTGVGQYLRGLRLSWAALRLADSPDPISEIAAAAGFFDQSHFTRMFRREFGLTPQAYRRAAGQ